MSGIDAKRHYERIVVKVGTSSLVDADGRVDHIKISRLVEQIALVRAVV